MYIFNLLTLLALFRQSLALPQARSWNVNQLVQTTSGLVQGHEASHAKEVSEYLGIPYAQPPVGNLRFAPPEPYHGNQTIINATTYGHSCPVTSTSVESGDPAAHPQLNYTASGIDILDDIVQVYEEFNEDCLFLNIWTKPQTGEKNKAVLLFIHGGSFTGGSAAGPDYNGEFFADQEDVVIVSINYRLNIFGFPGGISGGPNNLGLLDQRLAVEWTRDNIANFGGDPSRITLFGQSAGGASVDIYSYAWESDPIVAGFIPQSGLAQLETDNALTAGLRWYEAVAALGCGSILSSNASILACMRALDVNAIETAISSLSAFIPIIDDVIVFSDYPARELAGNFTLKPVLLGHNNYEAGLFIVLEAMQNITLPDAVWDSLQTSIYFCPAAARANVSVYHDLPVWRYRYFGDFPNMQLVEDWYTGAFHGSEVFALFDQFPSGEGVPVTTSQQASIASYMRGAWAAFAQDPVSGLTNYGWPVFDPKEDTLIRIGYQNETGTNATSATAYDSSCGTIFAAYQ